MEMTKLMFLLDTLGGRLSGYWLGNPRVTLIPNKIMGWDRYYLFQDVDLRLC